MRKIELSIWYHARTSWIGLHTIRLDGNLRIATQPEFISHQFKKGITMARTKTAKSEFMRVSIKELKFQPYNPPSRTEERHLGWLVESIQTVGLLVPIIVKKIENKYVLVDGHRRVAAFKMVGLDLIPAILDRSDTPVETLYAEINKNMKSHSGVEELAVWMVCESAVTIRAQKRFERFQDTFGRSIMNKIYHGRMSLVYLQWALRVRTYLGSDPEDKKYIQKIARWIINHKAQSAVRLYIAADESPKLLQKLIEQNKPLQRGWLTK